MAGTPKILIGIPMWLPDSRFLESLPKFCKELDGKCRYEVKIVGGDSLVNAQNEIVDYLLSGDYTHLLHMEDDHWGHKVEMLEALLKPDVEVCGINYHCRWYPYNSCLMEDLYHNRENQRFSSIERESGYQECDLVGFAMTLYKRSVFEKIGKPYFTLNKRGERWSKSYATDEDFCDRLKAHGIKMWGCWDYTLPHRDITKENVREIREKATIKFHELRRIQRITGQDYEITEEMIREPNFHELDGRHKNEICYIIGKGPSVQFLNESYFPTSGPVITLNETYEKVESLNIKNPIYSLQKDLAFGVPKRSTLLVHCWEESSQFAKNYVPRYEFDCDKLGLGRVSSFSATVAIKIAIVFGCKELRLISFDSCTVKDYRTQNFDVSVTIPYNKTAYQNQRAIQEGLMYSAGLKWEYITPGLQEGLVKDKSEECALGWFH